MFFSLARYECPPLISGLPLELGSTPFIHVYHCHSHSPASASQAHIPLPHTNHTLCTHPYIHCALSVVLAHRPSFQMFLFRFTSPAIGQVWLRSLLLCDSGARPVSCRTSYIHHTSYMLRSRHHIYVRTIRPKCIALLSVDSVHPYLHVPSLFNATSEQSYPSSWYHSLAANNTVGNVFSSPSNEDVPVKLGVSHNIQSVQCGAEHAMCMGHEPVVRRDSGRNIRFRDNVIRVSQLALLTFLLANSVNSKTRSSRLPLDAQTYCKRQ